MNVEHDVYIMSNTKKTHKKEIERKRCDKMVNCILNAATHKCIDDSLIARITLGMCASEKGIS